jgi:ligand-binding sensor domain-containing protein
LAQKVPIGLADPKGKPLKSSGKVLKKIVCGYLTFVLVFNCDEWVVMDYFEDALSFGYRMPGKSLPLRKVISRFFVFFTVFLVSPCLVGDVNERLLIAPSAFTADYWSVEEGLPRHSITALTQSTDGYLWIGMFDGIARFDGTSFRSFDQHSVDVLKSHSIRSIHADHRGKVWFGTAGGGISCYSNGRFVTYHTEDFDIASNYIGAVMVNTEGHVFMGSSGNGISQFQDGQVIAWNASGKFPELKAVSTLFQDRFGRVWAGTDGGLLRWMDDPDWARNEGMPWITVTTQISTTKVWKRQAVSTGMPSGKAVVVDEMPDGRLVVLHADGQLFRERQPQSGAFETVVDLHAQFPEKTNWIATRSMAVGHDGSVWIGDQGAGLFRVQQDVAEVFQIDGMPVEEKVWALLADKDGSIWVGGRSEGLMRIRRRVFQNYTTEHGLSDNLITSIMEDAMHKVWASTSAGGVLVIEENTIKHYPQTESIQDAMITCMLERSPAETWIGTYGQGLFEISEEGIHRPSGIDLPATLNGDGMVYSMILDGAGGLYVGTWGQHVYHLPKEGAPYRLAEELENRTVLTRVLAIDQEGTLWSGGKYGLLYRKPGEDPVAVSADSGLPDCEIYSLFVDHEGTLWVGTYGEGLFRKHGDRFIRYRLGESFVENTVSSIIEDDDGFIWLGTFTGIRRAFRHHLLSDGHPEWSYYGKSDGLGTYEMSGGHLGTVMKTSDGRLWFGTTYGLAVVDPAYPKPCMTIWGRT